MTMIMMPLHSGNCQLHCNSLKMMVMMVMMMVMMMMMPLHCNTIVDHFFLQFFRLYLNLYLYLCIFVFLYLRQNHWTDDGFSIIQWPHPPSEHLMCIWQPLLPVFLTESTAKKHIKRPFCRQCFNLFTSYTLSCSVNNASKCTGVSAVLCVFSTGDRLILTTGVSAVI